MAAKYQSDIRTYADPREAFEELDEMAQDEGDTLALWARLTGHYGVGYDDEGDEDDCLLD